MRSALVVLLALLFVAPVRAESMNGPAASYVLVDIGDLEDSMIQGSDVPGSIVIARYHPADRDIRGGNLSPKTALDNKASTRISIYKNPVVKTKGMRQYLVKVEPDIWVIEAINGTSMSLGSKSFEVKEGQVVDLGVIKPRADWVEGEKAPSAGSTALGALFFGRTGPKTVRPIYGEWHARTSNDLSVPSSIKHLPLVEANYQENATFGNYLGGLINRFGGRAARVKGPQSQSDDATTAQPATGS